MSDLTKSIETLTREEALEAAQNLALRISKDESPGDREEAVLKPLIEKPFENIQEIEQLARLVLLTAAANPENDEVVRSAIAGAGRKQFILGGAEIVVLATVGLFALNLLVTKGKASEHETIKIEEADGKTTITVENQVSYGISQSLGQVLKSYFGR
ncbi:MAG: hypothetical protein WCB68_04330 [Pyrinomonadaceae bacterium]